VAVVERYADGLAGPADLERAARAANEARAGLCIDVLLPSEPAECAAAAVWHLAVWGPVSFASMAPPGLARYTPRDHPDGWVADFAGMADEDRGKEQPHLARCVFGNPFRSAPFHPAWRTPDVLRLAEGVYAEGAFDRLPVLADLLEEAGATDAALLAHLRGPQHHALGCHALDAVLGKG
jgi:hypothetical protein